MKRTLLTLVIAFGMVSGIFADATWLTDHKQATEIAKKDQKPILMLFTGSDWCGYCIRFDKEFFSQKAFEEFAKDDIVLLEVDFPRKEKLDADTKAQNKKLAKKYGVRGYPTIYIVDADGDVIHQSGYGEFKKSKSSEDYIKTLKEKIAAKAKK
ncbi:MAG: thioredoxin family protein [Victivallaceae bacterium]|nr:thioredoxin family protein [Victivallaceae bacterium]